MTRKLIVATALLASVLAAEGCQEAKDKTKSTMSFVKGDADSVVERTPDQVVEAARAVAAEMQLIAIAGSTTQQDGKDVRVLTFRTAEDKKVTVRATPETPTATRLSVNTGLFGDSALRQQVVDKIKARLGVPAAATQPAAK
jgi:hypothetical protein